MKKLIFLLTFTFMITVFSHNGNTALVTDGLVSYWTFDRQDIAGGTAKDVWGENDGKIVGARKVVAGRVNGALEFDGSDDYVNLTNLGDFGSQVGTSTFEAWVKTSLKEDRWTTLFKVRDADCAMGWGIDLNGWREQPNFPNFLLERTHLVDAFWGFGPNFDENINFSKDVIRLYLTYKVGPFACLHSTFGRRVPQFRMENGITLVYVNGPSLCR